MNELDELFSRGVASFVDPGNNFRKKVEARARGEYSGDIVIKLGVDPTRPDIHLGHAVCLRKLRAFQDIGCKVIFLIGDYTSQIGDPTGKSKVRPEVSQKEIEANMKTYLDQVGKILRTENAVFSWIRNSDWFTDITDIEASPETKISWKSFLIPPGSFLGKALLFEETRMQKTHLKKQTVHTVSFTRVLSTLRKITHARLIERDMFQERFKKGDELYMHEMMYPVLQGIDSSALAKIYGSCDLEIGGTDQTFNMLMGRDVMKINGQPEQSVMSLDILEGLDGKEKMSKSLDNYVGINDEPNDMFGKIMSIPDRLIERYFLLATYTPLSEMSEISEKISSRPRDMKMRLAREIVAIYHGENPAKIAEGDFIETFSEGAIPKNVKEITFDGNKNIVDMIIEAECASSKTEARRLIDNGAVTLLEKEEKITDGNVVPEYGTYKVGKHRFFKLVK